MPEVNINLTIDKTTVGLSNVDNTSDADKPISTATQTALDLKLDAADYVQHFLGVYASLVALETAHPTATSGDYAQVDPGTGTNLQTYSWDTDEGWVLSSADGSGASNTDQLPEGATNLYYTTARVDSWWANILNSLVTFVAKILVRNNLTVRTIFLGNDANMVSLQKHDSTDFITVSNTGALKFHLLTGDRVVELDSNKVLISAAKGTAYNKSFGTTAGTVAEGDKVRTVDVTSDYTTPAPTNAYSTITGLSLSVEANKRYKISAALLLTGNGTNGMVVTVVMPSGTTNINIGVTGSTTDQVQRVSGRITSSGADSPTLDNFNDATNTGFANLEGTFTVGGTAGNVEIQVRTLSSVQAKVVQSGSSMTLYKLN